MLKKISHQLSKHPQIFNALRRVIENNFRGQKAVIRRELGEDPGMILDAPSGTGELSPLFNQKNYTGIDICERYVRYAERTYDRKFLVMDASQLSFTDETFDSALVVGFFHHLDVPTTEAVIKEVRRVLKPRGRLLLIEDHPTRSSWNFIGKFLQKYDEGAHIRPTKTYQDLLEKEFVVEKSYPMRSGLWDYTVFVMTKH
jgi:ubiquinone/menaquinone biosynthesis C-methylase UbiE